jgi:hypothetical protein
LSTHVRLGLTSGLFHSGFPTNILYAFHILIRATCPTNLILHVAFASLLLITKLCNSCRIS